jgi:hypothetical protein
LKLNDDEIIKIKGLNKKAIEDNKITLDTLELLLYKDYELDPHLKQDKFFKNISEGNIQILNQAYTLKATDNKRQLVYNENNKLVGSRPYFLFNGDFTNKD